MIEFLPRFEQIKHLTWLRRGSAGCLKYEYKRHIERLRCNPQVYAIEHEPPSAKDKCDALISITIFKLKKGENSLDCRAPYSQRAADWNERSSHPAEAVRIQTLLEMAQ